MVILQKLYANNMQRTGRSTKINDTIKTVGNLNSINIDFVLKQ